MHVLLATPGAGYLRETAWALSQRSALAGLWISDTNSRQLPSGEYRRCWAYHLAMKPFYHLGSPLAIERASYALMPLWFAWVRRQPMPSCEVVQAPMGRATELFDKAQGTGALKVVDCPNSHPVTFLGFWQRECDLWCPGEKVPLPQWFLARANRELERADLIVVPSTFCKDSMVLNGLAPEKILVNPFGVETTIFQKRERVPAKPRFVSVGAICVRKGAQYLFRAFEIVKRRLPEAELICAGGYKSDFRHERPKWEGSFTHYVSLPHSELAKLLVTCTAFVFPSQEEGFPRAQAEAMACGLPVIGTHPGGATTLVRDGVEGFIVNGRNPEQIAEAMIKLATNPQMNLEMGEASYRKGALRNTWADYGERLLAEYERRLGHLRRGHQAFSTSV